MNGDFVSGIEIFHLFFGNPSAVPFEDRAGVDVKRCLELVFVEDRNQSAVFNGSVVIAERKRFGFAFRITGADRFHRDSFF